MSSTLSYLKHGVEPESTAVTHTDMRLSHKPFNLSSGHGMGRCSHSNPRNVTVLMWDQIPFLASLIYKLIFTTCNTTWFPHPSLERPKAWGFCIWCLIWQPQPCCHMHDEADWITVLDLCHPHAINVPLWARVHFVLQRMDKINKAKRQSVDCWCSPTPHPEHLAWLTSKIFQALNEMDSNLQVEKQMLLRPNKSKAEKGRSVTFLHDNLLKQRHDELMFIIMMNSLFR